MRDGGSSASFADIAVSLTLALSKLRLDLAHTLIVAREVGMTDMGMEVVAIERELDIENISVAVDMFKKMSEVEPQVRAILERKAKRRWPDFARVAVL